MTPFPESRLDQTMVSDEVLRTTSTQVAGGVEPWRELTSLALKWATYECEASFRESLHDATVAVGAAELGALLQAHCEISVKPDGLASRVVAPLLRYMEERRFVPVAHRVHSLSPVQVRDIWRYQWNVATLDRLRLFDLIMAQAPVLTLYFRDTEESDIPATVRLRGLKGSAVPGLRASDSLRSACAAPNRLLTLIHAADEPIDILRELGIAYDSVERRWLLGELVRPLGSYSYTSLERDVEQLYAACPEQDFDRSRAETTLVTTLRRASESAARGFTAVGDDGVSFYAWASRYLDELRQVGVWDVITAASFRVAHDRPGHVCTIDDDGRPEWFAGHGIRKIWRCA